MSELTNKSEKDLVLAGVLASLTGADTTDILDEALRRVKVQYGLVDKEQADGADSVRTEQLRGNLDAITARCKRAASEIDSILDEVAEIREDNGL